MSHSHIVMFSHFLFAAAVSLFCIVAIIIAFYSLHFLVLFLNFLLLRVPRQIRYDMKMLALQAIFVSLS